MRTFTIRGLQSGRHPISLRIGDQILSVTTVDVYVPEQERDPTDGAFFYDPSIELADERTGGYIMKTSRGAYQLDIPFDGVYVLTATSGRAKFCNVSHKQRKECATGELVDDLIFTYADTYRGVLVFNLVPLDTRDVTLEVSRYDDRSILSTGRDISVSLPRDLDTAGIYRDDIL